MKRNERVSMWVSIVLLLAAVGIVCYPLSSPGFFVSDDGNWMIIRLSAFYQSLREGQFPVRFLGRLNHGYGYPVANFLYPGFMYIGSVIHLIGFSFVNTVKLLFAGSIAVGTLYIYAWLKKYFSSASSAVGAIAYAGAPYLLFDIYRRGSVGEVLALAWAAMGLYSIASKKPWLLSISTTLIIVSHNSLALLFLGLLALYISVLREWKTYWVMFGLGVGMATFFWFPALYETKYVAFNTMNVSNPGEYFLTAASASLLGYGGVLAILWSLFIRKPYQKEKWFFGMIFLFTVFMVLPVSGFLWNIPFLTRVIQFPYRLLSISVCIGTWFVAYVCDNAKNIPKYVFIILFLALAIWGVASESRQIRRTVEPEGYYTTNEATTTVRDEYMPKWVSVKPLVRAQKRYNFFSGQGTVSVNNVTTQTIDIVVHAREASVLEINTLYYPGWGATIDGVQVKIHYDNPYGVMRIAVPAGDHRLIVAFRETISRFAADSISLACFIVFAVLAPILAKNEKRKRK